MNPSFEVVSLVLQCARMAGTKCTTGSPQTPNYTSVTLTKKNVVLCLRNLALDLQCRIVCFEFSALDLPLWDLSQAKDPKRKILSDRFQSKDPKRKILSERSQAKDPKRKIPNESFQANDPKRKLLSERSQAKVSKRKIPSDSS